MQKVKKKIGIAISIISLLSVLIVGGLIFTNRAPQSSQYGLEDFLQITNSGSGWDFHSSISNDGNKVCFARFNPTTSKMSLNIYSIPDGNLTTVVSTMTGDFSSTWSPDDTQIAFDARATADSTSYIYILTIATGEIVRFSSLSGNAFRPDWSHDGQNIVYVSYLQLYIQPVSGGDAKLVPNADEAVNPTWNHDDTQILFSKENAAKDIYSINVDGSNLKFLAKGNSNDKESWARWSNDGTQIIYHLFDDGISSIAIKNLTSEKVSLLTDIGDCRFPDWSADGSLIVFSYDTNLWIFSFS
ncbi:TolB family protein [Candidatus Lokiarchaeum ossiferum]|uniref:TolB family protein n=1 Tax=Candidatus Lokiarchaeum ossiferum TaxID=2951803 RepID=UPI00352D1F10